MAAPVVKLESGEQDYHAWLVEQAAHLRARRFEKLDNEAIAEELEDMGRSERRAVESHLKNLLLHLLKWSRQANADLLEDSPSLRPQLSEFIERQYPRARRSAVNQTGLAEAKFPPTCPFTFAQTLDHEFFPEIEKE